MRLILTRPEQDALRWHAALQARGVPALALPLIGIGPARDQHALADARRSVPQHQAVMFVSRNAVAYFYEQNTAPAQYQSRSVAINCRAWAPGPGTAEALIDAGWPADRIDRPAADAPQFDSESLWAVVGPQIAPGVRILIVRGEEDSASADDLSRAALPPPASSRTSAGSGRDWLQQQIQQRGGSVDFVAAYARRPPTLTLQQLHDAVQAAGDRSLWLFSSSDAIRNLRRTLPQQSWAAARCLATHPRIAANAEAAGFGEIMHTLPTLDAVVETALRLASAGADGPPPRR